MDTQIHRSPAKTISRGGSSHPGSISRTAAALALQALPEAASANDGGGAWQDNEAGSCVLPEEARA